MVRVVLRASATEEGDVGSRFDDEVGAAMMSWLAGRRTGWLFRV